MPIKLNAMRVLDARQIPYVVTEYDATRAFHSAVEVAQLVGASVESVYKTLVVVRESPKAGKPLLVLIAADREVDLKSLARSLGAPKQKLRMATLREAESLTGLHVGGISPLALLNRGFEIVLDARALTLEQIHISAGARGVELRLAVQDLISVLNPKIIPVTRAEPHLHESTSGGNGR